MGLVDLKTDLKSLKYGTSTTVEDLPFAQPYVTVPIPQNNEPLTQIFLSVSAFNQPITFQNIGSVTGTILRGAFRNAGASMFGLPNISPSPNLSLNFNVNPRQAGTGGPDFLVRGGLLFPLIAARDVIRVGKTLASTKGLLFTTKQKLLQTTGLKPEYLQNVGAGTKVLNFLTQKGGYNPLNTLAQVGVVGLGGHLTRDGAINNIGSLLQSAESYEKGKYISYIENQQSSPLGTIGLSQNRLLGFYEQNQVRQKGQIKTPLPTIPPTSATLSFPIINQPDVLYTVFGGPDSVLGFGNTTIKTAKDRTGYGDKMSIKDKDNGANSQNPYLTYAQKDLYNAEPVSQGGKIQDFRATLRKNYPNQFKSNPEAELQIVSPSVDYNAQNRIENKFLLGDPDNKTRLTDQKIKSYRDVAINSEALDKITDLAIYDSEGPDTRLKDLVNFYIEGVDNDKPSLSEFLHFRAFLGPISDNYSPRWSDTQYVGRGEKFYTYQGFDRQISLSWIVPAQSYPELAAIDTKLNRLVSYTAPDYGNNGYMRAPIIRLTIGTLYNRLPGIITGINLEIDDQTPWETGVGMKQTMQMPHVIKVSSFNFTPIHQFAPQKTNNDRPFPYFGGPLEDER